jgi:hypothetical protein
MTIVAQLKAPERPEQSLYLIVWDDTHSRGGAEVRIADDGTVTEENIADVLKQLENTFGDDITPELLDSLDVATTWEAPWEDGDWSIRSGTIIAPDTGLMRTAIIEHLKAMLA